MRTAVPFTLSQSSPKGRLQSNLVTLGLHATFSAGGRAHICLGKICIGKRVEEYQHSMVQPCAAFSVQAAQAPRPWCRQALVKTIWRGSDRVV